MDSINCNLVLCSTHSTHLQYCIFRWHENTAVIKPCSSGNNNEGGVDSINCNLVLCSTHSTHLQYCIFRWHENTAVIKPCSSGNNRILSEMLDLY